MHNHISSDKENLFMNNALDYDFILDDFGGYVLYTGNNFFHLDGLKWEYNLNRLCNLTFNH